MKIGFDAKRAFNNSSGLGNYSRDVIRALAQIEDYSIYLFTTKLNPEIFDIKSNEFKAKIEVIEPSRALDKLLKSRWRSVSVSKEINSKELDIFHGLSNELPVNVGEKTKTVVTIHDLIFKRFPNWYKPIDRKIYDLKFKNACIKADKIIAISEQTKSDIIDFYDIFPEKIEVVYQTCNDSFKKKAGEEELMQVRAKYNLPKEFILNVGTIESRKNAWEIVKAIHQNKISMPLVIVGRSTYYAEKIKAYINEHKLGEQITLLHNVTNTDLPLLYQSALVCVYPSTFEGFGLPIIEALYSGTPVITSKGGCFSEAGGPDSIYVESQNTEELADAIIKVIEDKNLGEQMSAKGLEYVQRFNNKNVTNNLIKVYEQLLIKR